MAMINFVLQGKGGVGKSLVASLLAQHYRDKNIETLCLDTDPVNRTFASYKALNVQNIEMLDDGNVNVGEFDRFTELLLNAPNNAAVVVDNGASTFLPLCAYLKENEVISFLIEQGHDIKLHTVVTGGPALLDTMNGLNALMVNFPDVPIVIWLNSYFGKPEMNGVSVEKSKLLQNASPRIYAFIRLKELNEHDFKSMLEARMTFAEARECTNFSLMKRQRLIMIQRAIAEQINQAQLLPHLSLSDHD